MVYELFDWFELTLIGQAIRNSLWLFPVIEAVHLLALAGRLSASRHWDTRYISRRADTPSRAIFICRHRCHATHRNSVVLVRGDQVLLQHVVLGKDVRLSGYPDFHLHGARSFFEATNQ